MIVAGAAIAAAGRLARHLLHGKRWTNMACCLKAYVEHGINLRERFY